MTDETPFSKRHGYVEPRDIVYRADLPDELRQPIIDILRQFAGTAFLRGRIERLFNPYGLDPLPQRPEPVDVSEDELRADFADIKRTLLACDWFRLYDVIEDVFAQLRFHEEELADVDEEPRAFPFIYAIDHYFEHAGIGWKMLDGHIVIRGNEAFEVAVASAGAALTHSGRPTAARHIHDALQSLSRRPTADHTGAIYHAMADQVVHQP